MASMGVIASVGTIDQCYRGEISVTLFNFNFSDYKISAGDRIAQCAVKNSTVASIRKVDTFKSTTDRGEKGFGSTGKK